MIQSIPARIRKVFGGKGRASVGPEAIASIPHSDRPRDREHRESVIAIWAMGKTDLDIVRARIEEQFKGLTPEEVNLMMSEVMELGTMGEVDYS